MKIYEYSYINNNKKIEKDFILLKEEERKIFQLTQKEKLIKIEKLNLNKKFSKKDEMNFFYNISNLLRAGLALKKIIEFQKENEKEKSKKGLYGRIEWKLEQGDNIFEILRELNIIKNSEMILAYAVENTGDLQKGFEEMYRLRGRKERLKKDIVSALAYPIFIIVISTIIIIFLMFFIVPNFIEMYDTSQEELPLLTKFIVGSSIFLRKYFYIFFINFLCFIFFLIFLERKFYIFSKIKLVKHFLIKKYFLLIIENLSWLLEAGISIDKGVEVILKGIENREIKKSLKKILEIKKEGELAKIFLELNLVTSVEAGILKIGEETGEVSRMLKKISELRREKEMRDRKIFMALLEPITILFIGIVVGVFVIGLYLPILNLTSTLF